MVCICMRAFQGCIGGLGGYPPPSKWGGVDTTKTRSDPQRVRMSSGGRQIGAAKGKQLNTEALCRTPPRPWRPAYAQPLCP